MSRVQLAPNVDDIDAAVVFYSQLFDAEPAKRRPEYANFALDEPALTLMLAQDGTTCCYALQDKIWVTSPSGEPWEVYTVLADAVGGCCGTDPDTLTHADQTASAGACCPV